MELMLDFVQKLFQREFSQFSTEPSLQILQELLRHLRKQKQQQRKALVQNISQHEI